MTVDPNPESSPSPRGRGADSTGQEEVLQGVIERIAFRNEDTGFAVVRFAPSGENPLSAVGPLAQLIEGQEVRLTGRRSWHDRFGRQLEVRVAEALLPTSRHGLIAYLSSSLVKGIGPAMAERIVDTFGEETLEIIDQTPSRLEDVKGLGKKRIEELVEAVRGQKDIQQILVFLRTHGLGQGLAARIAKRYGAQASSLIQANPYRLADEVIGVGFRTADRLALRMGVAEDAPERIQAGLVFQLGLSGREGHCFVPIDDLAHATANLLGSASDAVAAQIPALVADGKVVLDQIRGDEGAAATTAVYPRTLHDAETGVARALQRLLTAGDRADIEQDLLADALRLYERTNEVTLPEGQRQAVMQALLAPVSVITGGPGVGKTTVVRAIAELLSRQNKSLLLAAPTGRAAKRLEESTGRPATTLHRLLEFQAGVGRFARDAQTQLEGDVLVVDETSMLDVQLAYNLFRAIPKGMRLVLVGDVDQLPAVGPGNVLDDIIRSGTVPVTMLTQVFRQAGNSRIVEVAHGVLRGEAPADAPTADEAGDFFFIEARSSEHGQEIIRELMTKRIPRAFGLDPMRDVQVITPMYRGAVGADDLNQALREALNPIATGAPNDSSRARGFREGDKVMQVRNDHDAEVYNGDVGRITGIDVGESRLWVRFGDGAGNSRELEYRFGDLDNLVPAYAISVHRSQGSEYPAVVIPLATEHFMMLRRNLLYTAITRGKRLVVLVGSRRALEMAVSNHQAAQRHSALAERLRG